MILVGQYDSFPTRRVAVALHHYGMPFKRDTRSVFSDALAIGRTNPLIRIPSLILDDGEILIDSSAILDHLDELADPDKALAPRAGPLRRRILQAAALSLGTGEKAGNVVYERHFHPADSVSRDWEGRCLAQLAAGLAEMERRIDGPWFCGDAFSHADIAAACTVGYLRLRLQKAFAAGKYPGLEALALRCEALASFKAAAIGADERMPSDGS